MTCPPCEADAEILQISERFWLNVDRTPGCWLWKAGRTSSGYGQFYVGPQRQEAAHRMAWMLTNGPIGAGLFVLHKCDNPPCVNPEHLFLGTNKDNMEDKRRKGRCQKTQPNRCGDKNPLSKLTAPQVVEIRRLAAMSVTCATLAREYGVSAQTVSCIVRRTMWRHV